MTSAENESVVKDILEELDRERSRRAELEATVRQLQDASTTNREETTTSYVAMETKLAGFQQIIDTLTRGKPAIAAAMQKDSKMPAHIVRLLEVVPWDPRARPHIQQQETMFEWQVYRDGGWKTALGLFPPMLRILPVANNSNRGNSLFPTRKKLDRVLTDASVTVLYETEAGYALPEEFGSWQWAGGWKLERLDGGGDEECWSYAEKPQHFLQDDEKHVFHSSSSNSDGESLPFRRRCWTRQRVLVDYPFASEATKQYLSMVAETARLAFTAEKLNEQLVETKATLTETERLLCEAREGVNKGNEPEMGNDSGRSKMSTETAKTDSSATTTLDLSGKLTQWVQATRKMSEDMTVSDESLEEGSISVGSSHGSVSTEADKQFDWKRFSRGTMMKWKAQQSRAGHNSPHFNIQGNPLFRKIGHTLDPASHHGVDHGDDDDDDAEL